MRQGPHRGWDALKMCARPERVLGKDRQNWVPESLPPPYVSPALTRAVDYLDLVWRLRFDKGKHLTSFPEAANVVALETDCSTSEQFEKGLSALADTFKHFKIDPALFAPKEFRGDQTLGQLEEVLRKQLDPPEYQGAKKAIDILRATNNLRAAAQHSKTRFNKFEELQALGIQYYPDVGWKETWNQLRAKVVEALYSISTGLKNAGEQGVRR